MATKNSELQFDIEKFGGEVKIYDAYPELLPYKQYHHISDKEWKIAILMVDIGSSYSKVKDQSQKMESIFEHLNLDKHKDAKIFQDCIKYAAGDVMDACSFLIEYQNNHKFAAWYEMNKLYYQLMAMIRRPARENEDEERLIDKKTDLQYKATKMMAELEKLETDLFGTAAMKAAAFRSKRKMEINWNEKYAQDNQVE